ncbi:MAG TPA: type II secretion system protein [Terriglobales bacterium]|nr:type II secretion system protein [Terriglobales bacterium]
MKFRSQAGGSKLHNSKARDRGFTLMEMAVVITLILILVAIAVPRYEQMLVRAKEAKLHQNLTTLNKVIQEYSLDKKHAPNSLDDLVPGYIKFIPDDITGSNDWVADPEDPEDQWDANQSGIKGVHSASNEISSEGTPYSSWTH